MGKRYASVWDALPEDLREADRTASMLTECHRLTAQTGFALVLIRDWWHLTAPGMRVRCANIADVREWLRKRIKTAYEPLAGAACTVDLDLPANALQAVFVAFPIDTNNWTDDQLDATRTRDTDDVEVSNEF